MTTSILKTRAKQILNYTRPGAWKTTTTSTVNMTEEQLLPNRSNPLRQMISPNQLKSSRPILKESKVMRDRYTRMAPLILCGWQSASASMLLQRHTPAKVLNTSKSNRISSPSSISCLDQSWFSNFKESNMMTLTRSWKPMWWEKLCPSLEFSV